MPISLIAIIAALLSGVAISISDPLMSMIGQRLGTVGSIFIVHIGGTLAAAVLLVLFPGNIGAWRSLPWYALASGALGVIVVGGVVTAIPRLGVLGTSMLLIVAQLSISAMLDHFGLLVAVVRPLDVTRVVGIAILIFGAWLIMR